MLKENKNIHAGHRGRLKKRFAETQGKGFEDHELLELFLFYSIPRNDTNATAHMLLDRFGSLEGVMAASTEELIQVDGIGKSTALLIKAGFELHMRMLCDVPKNATFNTYEEIGEHVVKLFTHIKTETVMLLLFDKKGRIIRTSTIAAGNTDRAMVDMRKLLTFSIADGASKAAMAHNHPSGVTDASFDDRVITMQVEELLRSLGIKLVEHYIVADGNYAGIKHNNLMS